MSDSQEKLRNDLIILEAMANEMDDYLKSEVLFWPLSDPSMARLTVGAYLMRQHRLVALRHLLDEDGQKRLDASLARFNQALVERIVRFEQRAHKELEARVRQWQEQLRDMQEDKASAANYYPSTVENRAIIAALLDRLRLPPYRLDDELNRRIKQLDDALRSRWQSGDFVWPEEWQPAYPRDRYWWLYGRPA